MKLLKFLFPGIVFGIVMTKSEAVSWFRIQEMFLFESFHMYGIIGTAVVLGIILFSLIKKYNWKTIESKPINIKPKDKRFASHIIGGIIFGLGWSMIGACPGPMFTLLGHGVFSMLIVIAGALLGTFIYGLIRSKLIH